jgi:hypothetical protein
MARQLIAHLRDQHCGVLGYNHARGCLACALGFNIDALGAMLKAAEERGNPQCGAPTIVPNLMVSLDETHVSRAVERLVTHLQVIHSVSLTDAQGRVALAIALGLDHANSLRAHQLNRKIFSQMALRLAAHLLHDHGAEFQFMHASHALAVAFGCGSGQEILTLMKTARSNTHSQCLPMGLVLSNDMQPRAETAGAAPDHVKEVEL